MIFPAIDLKAGQSVRLYQGDFDQATLINNDPVEQAKAVNAAGLHQLHVVDLDGAKAGQPENFATVAAIRAAFDGTVEIGGGIRSRELAELYLKLGIDRIILGSVALSDPTLVKQLLATYGGERIVIGIDGQNGLVVTDGWLKQSQVKMSQLMTEMLAAGARHFIVTDVARDGTLQGPNVGLYSTLLAQCPQANLVAGGGVRTLADVQTLQAIGCQDVIIGKALAAGTVTLEELAGVVG
ncbi:1-(5-phosphoribosyl)-5-[(5-phosphoribosylamino)methylideneamino]imidazole-4-carboxamide isomerase [Lactiplantibacillus plajomi]|uniref:1-(5-phosphoribosyl)-5-[(5-phosphoribosylamino)methylideneamino] imidazole-4-carboxamide isomerase n=1 Tax=Lactiplantibacillus plajomi TaxID=1457217 RepID=A0ABV6K0I8_9LACO|nr:1-(5-phosphoribosyl)-5-[(5-phosphoribosylamino)methylideneamino]imidazole-4-carboxamide isomerase [Lactiplantibacillus plajomi]